MIIRALILGLAVLVFIGTVACDESLSTLAGPTPNLEPTFSSIQRNIFDQSDSAGRLACTQCHTGRNPFAPMNLTSGNAYAALVGVSSVLSRGAIRVIPGNPDGSYLVHKLEGRPGIVGVRMPFTPPYLTDGQILVIKRWIELGARND